MNVMNRKRLQMDTLGLTLVTISYTYMYTMGNVLYPCTIENYVISHFSNEISDAPLRDFTDIPINQ